MKSSRIWQLFLEFFKIGAFTFGGGYAMIPMIQKEIVENKEWLSPKDILDVVAIAETTPGPIAVNTATFVGYKVRGIKGALAATLGVVLPSFFIIVLIAFVFQKYMGMPIIEDAFWGVRIGVLALMVKAFITMYKQCPKNAVSYFVAVLALVSVAIFNISALIMIFIAAVLGIVNQCVRKGHEE